MGAKATDEQSRIAVLGAGSWGGTLARILAAQNKDVSLWTRDEQKARALAETRLIEKPLHISLPPNLLVSSNLEKCLEGRDIIIFACTSQSMRSVASLVKAQLKLSTPVPAGKISDNVNNLPALVSAAKGLELDTFQRMSEVLQEVCPELVVASLSGPNLAAEILKGLPTASVIACKDADIATKIQKSLTVPTLRFYSNTDLTGVELGGSFKNVIAIASGGVDGLGLGTNAKAALMTRGLAEMTRIAVALGAKASTLAGLAGLGDLVATCSSPLSRNYRLGYMIARGSKIKDAEAELGAVAEGVNTARALCDLARKMNIELPIASQVEAALNGDISPQRAIMNLMNRPLVSE